MADQRLIINVATEIDELRRGLTEARNLTQEYATYALKQIQTLEQAKVQAQNQGYNQTKQIYDRARNDLRAQYEEAKRLAQGNAQELLRIEQRYLTNRERLERESTQQLAQAQERQVQQSAQRVNELRGRARKQAIREELAEYERMYQQELAMAQGNARRIAQLQSQRGGARAAITRGRVSAPAPAAAGGGVGVQDLMGGVGGVMGKLGPWGMAGAAALGAITAGVTKANDAYREFADSALKVKTMLDETQAQKLPESMAQLRDIALQTGEPVKNLSQALYDTLSAIPSMSANMGAATKMVESASRAAIGLGADTGSVINAMTNLANASNLSMESLSNQNMVLDVMAQTIKLGKVEANELAQYLAVPAPAMAALTKNADDSVRAIGAMYAQFTASGVRAAEASTQIRSLANEMMKGEVSAKLLAAGVQGINAKGQVEDWSKGIQSMGQDVNKFVKMFGSEEAQNAVRILAKQGGDAFAGLVQGMKDSTGVAESLYDTMAQTGEALAKRADAAWNDMWITIGESTNGIGILWDQMSISVAGSLTSLFESSAAEANRFTTQFQTSIDQSYALGEAIKSTNEAINQAGVEGANSPEIIAQQMAKIGEIATQYKDTFPAIAQEIQKIISATPEGTATTATLDQLNAKLREMQELATAEAMLSGFEAMEAGAEALEDKLNEVAYKGIPALKKAGGIYGALFGIDVDDQLGAFEGAIKNTSERIKALREEQKGLDKTSAEGAERSREINLELRDLIKEQQMAAGGLITSQNVINSEFQKELDIQTKINDPSLPGEKLSLEQQMVEIKQNLIDRLGAEGQTEEYINNLIMQKGLEIAKANGDKEAYIALLTQDLEAEKQSIENEIEKKVNMGWSLEAAKEQYSVRLDEIDALEESIAIEVDKVGIGEANLTTVEDTKVAHEDTNVVLWDSVDAIMEATGLTAEQSFIEKDVAAATNEILNNNSLTTAQKIAQLEALKLQYDTEAQKKLIELDSLLLDQNKTAEKIKQTQELQKQIAILGAAGGQVQASLDKFKTQTFVDETLKYKPKRGGGGSRKSESDREAEKAKRESEKKAKEAEREREKAEKEALRRQEELEKKRLKQYEEQLKAEVEIHKQKIKEANDIAEAAQKRKEAEEKLRKSIQDFSDKLRDELSKSAVGQLSKVTDIYLNLLDEFQKAELDIAMVRREYEDQVRQKEKESKNTAEANRKAQEAYDIAVAKAEAAKKAMERAQKELERAQQAGVTLAGMEEKPASYEQKVSTEKALKAQELQKQLQAEIEKAAKTGKIAQDTVNDLRSALKDFGYTLPSITNISKQLGAAITALSEAAGETETKTVPRQKQRGEKSVAEMKAENETAVSKAEATYSDLKKKYDDLNGSLDDLEIAAKQTISEAQLTAEATEMKKNMIPVTLFVETSKKLAIINKTRAEIEQLYKQAAEAATAKDKTALIEQAIAKQDALSRYMERNNLTQAGLASDLIEYNKEVQHLININAIKQEDLNVEVETALQMAPDLIAQTEKLGQSIDNLKAKAAVSLFTAQLQESYTNWLAAYKQGYPQLVSAVDAMNSLINNANQIDMNTAAGMEKARQEAISFYLAQIDQLTTVLTLLPQESAEYTKLAGEIAEARRQLNLLQGEDSPAVQAQKAKQAEEDKKAVEDKAAAEAKASEERKTANQKNLDDLTKMINGVQKYTDLIFESIDAMKEIGTTFKTGETGEGVQKVGDLTKKVGEALLNSGNPQLAGAGAALLGVGMIINIFGKILSLFDKEKSGKDIAQERLDLLNAQVDAYNAQKEAVDNMIAMGAKEVDTAKERLEILRQQTEELKKQNYDFAYYMYISDEQLKREKQIAEARQRSIDLYSSQIDMVKEWSEKDQMAWAEAAQKATGIMFDFGKRVTEGDLTAFADKLTEAGLDVEATLTNINLATEAKLDEIDAVKERFDNKIATMDWIIQVSLDLGEKKKAARLLRKKLNLVRDELAVSLVDAGIQVPVNLSTMDQKALLGFISSISKAFGGEVPEEFKSLFDSILGTMNQIDEVTGKTTEKSGEEADNRLRLLEHERKELEYKKEIGELDQAAYDKALEDLLLRKVNMQHVILNELVAQNATTEQILSAQEAIWDTEKEIYNLKHAQNEENDIALRKAQELSRQRNAMVESMKAGGTYSAAEIKQIEDQIIATLREAGASEDQIMRQIETFRATLPRFAQGGYMPGGMVISDAGEFAVKPSSASEIERMYPGFLDKLNTDPLQAFKKLWSEYMYTNDKLTQLKSSSTTNNSGVTFGNIYVSIAGGQNANGQQIANEIKKELDRTFQGRGIQLTQL